MSKITIKFLLILTVTCVFAGSIIAKTDAGNPNLGDKKKASPLKIIEENSDFITAGRDGTQVRILIGKKLTSSVGIPNGKKANFSWVRGAANTLILDTIEFENGYVLRCNAGIESAVDDCANMEYFCLEASTHCAIWGPLNPGCIALGAQLVRTILTIV